MRKNTRPTQSLIKQINMIHRGFSLIELMVVITILGIVLLILVPNFASMQQKARVRAGANEIAQDIRQTRERALSTGRAFDIIRFDARHYQVNRPDGSNVQYKLGQTTGGNLQFGTTGGIVVVPPEANQGTPPANGFDFIGNILILEPRGAANNGVIYLTDGMHNYAIGINSIGKVRVYTYASGTGTWN